MDFSLCYFASGDSVDRGRKYDLLMAGAKFADQQGFTAIWTPERHFGSFGALFPNPSVISAALACITEKVGIRAGSVVAPLHNAIRVAEEWAVVDNLSNGRVAVSFASGWHPDDFVFAPDSYHERRTIMLYQIDTIRRLWRGEPMRARGGAGNELDIRIHPRPIQPELPFWLTSSGSLETFRTAGVIGANLLTHLLGQSVEQLAEKIGVYRASYVAHNPNASGRVTLMIHTYIGDDLDGVREIVRGPLCNYLKGSLDLIRHQWKSLEKGPALESLSEDDLDAILHHAFDRYFQESGLLGTPSSCLRMVQRLEAIGVDELACLIDFGLDFQAVIEGLHRLNGLKTKMLRREIAVP